VKIFHKKSSSIETENDYQKNRLNYLRQWHYMWSKFYFYKKNFNTVYALLKTLILLLKDFQC